MKGKKNKTISCLFCHCLDRRDERALALAAHKGQFLYHQFPLKGYTYSTLVSSEQSSSCTRLIHLQVQSPLYLASHALKEFGSSYSDSRACIGTELKGEGSWPNSYADMSEDSHSKRLRAPIPLDQHILL